MCAHGSYTRAPRRRQRRRPATGGAAFDAIPLGLGRHADPGHPASPAHAAMRPRRIGARSRRRAGWYPPSGPRASSRPAPSPSTRTGARRLSAERGAPVNSHRLPRTVVPGRYDIRLEPDLDTATYAGDEVVQVEVRDETDEVLLNAVELTITKIV